MDARERAGCRIPGAPYLHPDRVAGQGRLRHPCRHDVVQASAPVRADRIHGGGRVGTPHPPDTAIRADQQEAVVAHVDEERRVRPERHEPARQPELARPGTDPPAVLHGPALQVHDRDALLDVVRHEQAAIRQFTDAADEAEGLAQRGLRPPECDGLLSGQNGRQRGQAGGEDQGASKHGRSPVDGAYGFAMSRGVRAIPLSQRDERLVRPDGRQAGRFRRRES